jgi:hypothetical protein
VAGTVLITGALGLVGRAPSSISRRIGNIVALARDRPDFPTRTRFLLLLGPLICMALGLGQERFLSFGGDVDASILRGALSAVLAFLPEGIAAA